MSSNDSGDSETNFSLKYSDEHQEQCNQAYIGDYNKEEEREKGGGRENETGRQRILNFISLTSMLVKP